MSSGAMTYIMEMVAVILAIAIVVPIAFTILFNGTDTWGNTPTYLITLMTTGIAVFFALGIMLKMMPQDIKSRVGLWYIPNYARNPTELATNSRYTQETISALNHFEV